MKLQNGFQIPIRSVFAFWVQQLGEQLLYFCRAPPLNDAIVIICGIPTLKFLECQKS